MPFFTYNSVDFLYQNDLVLFTHNFEKFSFCKNANFDIMIFHDFKYDLTPKQYIGRLHLAFGDESQSKRSVHNWFVEFPHHLSGKSSVYEVREMIQQKRHVTYREI